VYLNTEARRGLDDEVKLRTDDEGEGAEVVPFNAALEIPAVDVTAAKAPRDSSVEAEPRNCVLVWLCADFVFAAQSGVIPVEEALR